MNPKREPSLAKPDPAYEGDLDALWQRCARINREYLDAIGDYPPLAPILLLALSRVHVRYDGKFEFDRAGEPAIITPIRGTVTEPDGQWYGETGDLVAWHPSRPVLATYHGTATMGYPKRGSVAHAHPLPWFRAGCEGVVVLQW